MNKNMCNWSPPPTPPHPPPPPPHPPPHPTPPTPHPPPLSFRIMNIRFTVMYQELISRACGSLRVFQWLGLWHIMETSSNENIFRITGPLWGESTGHRWISLRTACNVELWCFLWSPPEQMIERTIGDLGRHRAHYDVIIMCARHAICFGPKSQPW